MPDQKTRIIELFPGTPEGEAKCMQGCHHCPAKVLPEDYDNNSNLRYSAESAQAVERLIAYYQSRNDHPSLSPQGIPLLNEKGIKAINLGSHPISFDFNLRQSAKDYSREKIIQETKDTIGKAIKQFPELQVNQPRLLGINIVPELDDFGFFMDIPQISIALKTAVDNLLNPSQYLELGLDINRSTPAQYKGVTTSDGHYMAKQLKSLFYNIFDPSQNPTKLPNSITTTIQEKAHSTQLTLYFHIANGPDVIIGSRIINHANKPSPTTDPSKAEIGNSIALNPDHVWISHSTFNVKDKSLRMNYPTFFTLLTEAEKDGTDLHMLLATHVRNQRNQSPIPSTSRS